MTKEETNTASLHEYFVSFRSMFSCFRIDNVYPIDGPTFSIIFVFCWNSQEEYSPEDPANPCVNYPTEEYESYADCDDHFVRSFLPPGLKPIWTVDNISEATDHFYLDYELYLKPHTYLGLYLYSLIRPSSMVCKLFSIYIRL